MSRDTEIAIQGIINMLEATFLPKDGAKPVAELEKYKSYRSQIRTQDGKAVKFSISLSDRYDELGLRKAPDDAG